MWLTAFSFCRKAVCETQQQTAEPDLPLRPAPPIIQLWSSGNVERWLPDGFVLRKHTHVLEMPFRRRQFKEIHSWTLCRQHVPKTLRGFCEMTFSNAEHSHPMLLDSGSELPDSRGADGPEPGPLPCQRPLWIHPQTGIPVQPQVQLQPREHGGRAGSQPHTADYPGECQSRPLPGIGLFLMWKFKSNPKYWNTFF